MSHSSDPAPSRAANRLAEQTSPYLLQHAHNPVDWYPWGAEALSRARAENRPIFLSIGYSACHWCHVMERESFENEAIAKLMNEHFVCIKVDREERPDLDEIYMKAVQAISGSGGWPMSVFLTPELAPFYGGTYFPPVRRFGRPSFPEVLLWIADTWKRDRHKLVQQGANMVEVLRRESAADTRGEVAGDVLDRSLAMLAQNFDPAWGGFGGAPKFPHAMDLRLLLRHGTRTGNARALDMALVTLERMARGGIYDQLAGGFARYSVDEQWRVPHFEKMLYDNALLVPAYLEAFQLTRNPEHARIARETLDWALAEMRTAEGAFASALDADSEGEEGLYYVWTPAEIEAALDPRQAAWALEYWDVTGEGNFEHGKSVLWRPEPASEVAQRLNVPEAELEHAMAAARRTLLRARAGRVRPFTDDKVLTAWNGLMLSALARGAQVLEDARYLEAAQRAAGFVLETMRRPDGRLWATSRFGRAHIQGGLDDHAFLIQGLLDLFESDFDLRWLRAASDLEQLVHAHFRDRERGGWFTTADDHEALIARLKAPHDGALPAGAGVQCANLLRLAELTGRSECAERAEEAIRSQAELLNRYPAAFSQILMAVDHLARGPLEVVIAGDPGDARAGEMLRAVRQRFLPGTVVALARPGADASAQPMLAGRIPEPGEVRAYLCRNYACSRPADDAAALQAQLEEARPQHVPRPA